MSKPQNPYAFPSPDDGRPADGYGMSLRDWFAGQAVGALLAQGLKDRKIKDLASDEARRVVAASAYAIADAMLAARAKGGAE